MKFEKINVITSAYREPENSVLIIYTGGTLGMVHDKNGALIPFDFTNILEHLPSLRQLELNVTVVSFLPPVDSSNMKPSDWITIAGLISDHYDEFDGFVVLHGTDTMAYTASALSFMLENLTKPVVFTGAQLPISAVRSDARENLITSLQIASMKQYDQAVVPEVSIFFNNILLRANRSRKVESIYFDAFESDNYPVLAEAGVVINYNMPMIQVPDYEKPITIHTKFDENIALLKLFPGISERMVRAVLDMPDLRGVVLETFGAGNAITDEWFINLLRDAIARGVTILNISQCTGGRVLQGRYSTSELMLKIGVLGGADLTTESALAKLMMVLGEEEDTARIKKRLMAPICGEMSLI